MSPVDEAGNWARRFGLAIAPLFEREAVRAPGFHSVLLDGAQGTFAMSVSEEELWRDRVPANWAWSSDISHHVTVTLAKVAVLRWDRPEETRVFERSSIERNLDRFYRFLTQDRLRSNRGVIDHLLGFFRRLRSLGHAAGLPDARATDLFTASLARLLAQNEESLSPEHYGLAEDAQELLTRLEARGFAAAVQEIERGTGGLSWLRLHPSLVVRHAGGQLFQEAHFELLRGATNFDLFGLVGAPEVAATSRGGTHFTPPTLARSLVERALAALENPAGRDELVMCDPACGSGAFLHETLRALRRLGYRGRLRLIGHDISPAAIAMARFAVTCSLHDWTPEGGVDLDLRAGDSLGELGMPSADVVVMNPPFIGFAMQTPAQREQLTAALGSSSAGRGDYSMAFVLRALEALKPGGVLGTIFPASLLSLKAASIWRERLLDLADLHFLASIGDFGLFSHALVQVAGAVFSKSHAPERELVALVTENDPQATSVALRQLRRQARDGTTTPIVEDAWSTFPVPVSVLRGRPTWRLPTPKAERVLKAMAQAGLPSVGDLFDIAQGIQTGFNEALLLTTEEFRSLPPRASRRPAACGFGAAGRTRAHRFRSSGICRAGSRRHGDDRAEPCPAGDARRGSARGRARSRLQPDAAPRARRRVAHPRREDADHRPAASAAAQADRPCPARAVAARGGGRGTRLRGRGSRAQACWRGCRRFARSCGQQRPSLGRARAAARPGPRAGGGRVRVCPRDLCAGSG